MLQNQIIALVAKASNIYGEMADEQQISFNASIGDLTVSVNEEQRFMQIGQVQNKKKHNKLHLKFDKQAIQYLSS